MQVRFLLFFIKKKKKLVFFTVMCSDILIVLKCILRWKMATLRKPLRLRNEKKI